MSTVGTNVTAKVKDKPGGAAEEKKELKRSLEIRHMNMIAIGGAIGTGLFLGSGGAITSAGPGAAQY